MSALQGRPGEETKTAKISGMLLTESCTWTARVIPSTTNKIIIAKKITTMQSMRFN